MNRTEVEVDRRPRLLAVSAVPPWPPRNGVSLRASNFLEELARRWHITVVSPVGESDASHQPAGIDWIRVSGIPATDSLPWTAERTQFSDRVRTLLSDRTFDAGLVWCGAEFVASEIPNFPPSVADRIDCNTLQFWRGGLRERGLRARLRTLRRAGEFFLYERTAFRPYATVVVTGPDDARALRVVSGHRRVVSIPNGVANRRAFTTSEGQIPTVIFTGVLDYPPNIDAARYFAETIWPGVRDKLPIARFVIAGRNPAPAIIALGRLPGVELHVDVPDMTAELRSAWLAVAPMQSGSGIKNKVLEAWAAGRPTVLTPLATNGLKLDEAACTLVAHNATEMRAMVLTLLLESESRAKLGAAARRLAEQEHSWPVVTERLEALLAALVPDRQPPGYVP